MTTGRVVRAYPRHVRVAVTGSHGLIGTALLARLRSAGHEPVPLVRGEPAPGEIGWDPQAGRLDPLDIWIAILVGHATRCALSVLRFRQGKWRGIVVDLGVGTR